MASLASEISVQIAEEEAALEAEGQGFANVPLEAADDVLINGNANRLSYIKEEWKLKV